MNGWPDGNGKDFPPFMPGGNPVPGTKVGIPPLGEILQMPPGDLCRLDLGFRNLMCATGLPDTRNLSIPACLAKLHEWSQHVKRETERNLHRFRENPGQFRNSESYFRAGMMITVLQQDLGVRYNPDSANTEKFLNSGEGFIHGLLMGLGGTCANLPVLYAAIGRKLGYPIYICGAKRHLFNRWASSDGRELFNIEGSGQGFGSFPDEYYMNGRYKIDPREVHQGFYLRSLDPAEEVGIFMETRGHCLMDHGLVRESIVAYAEAHRFAPFLPTPFYAMMKAINEELRIHAEGKCPRSYREWENWDQIPRPTRKVLKDDFERIDKTRPVFRPTEVIVTPGFLKGDNHGV